jgi:hypothetical protein|tara:strand:- start:5908 stop:6609 length:702 start_codon:yes stop_codon:yes gene_type:complete
MTYKNNDIEDLLVEISEKVDLIYIQTNYEKIKKITIKNTLENMRSVLDYIAQDVLIELNKITPTNTGKYFPYGKTIEKFNEALTRNSFSQLSRIFPRIYDLFLAQQPFTSNNNWLVDLCSLTNEVKHNNLVSAENHTDVKIVQPGFARFDNPRNFASYGNIMIDGSGIHIQDDIFVDDSGGISIKKNSGNTVVIRENKIIFNGKNIEIKYFFGNCLDNINNLYQSLIEINFNN